MPRRKSSARGSAPPSPLEATDALSTYRGMRNFERTPEPSGEVGPHSGRRFVVQLHHATRRHYDFRLELDGVMESWAVPEGPSLDPADKRLAVHTESHPLEYASFEGVIPKGEYGAGTVMVWDEGRWISIGSARRGYDSGKLKFRLEGHKLRGAWTLVRMKGREGSDKNWLLIKERDDEVRKSADYNVTEALPLSVQSGRSIEDIAAQADRTWRPSVPAAAQGTKPVEPQLEMPAGLNQAKAAPMPDKLEFQLATSSQSPPDGDAWLHEIKFDGYRVMARLRAGQARLTTRNGHDWTRKFAPIAEALATLDADEAMLDGEIVVMNPDGTTDFGALQQALADGHAHRLSFMAFDLLHYNGLSLLDVPLTLRKQLLGELVADAPPVVRYTEHVVGHGPVFYEAARRLNVEGMVSKRAKGGYVPGRGDAWRKVKFTRRDELVVGGYTEPNGSGNGRTFGALLVGAYDQAGAFVYCGRVGTGYDDRALRELPKRFGPPLEHSPFVSPPPDTDGVHYVTPRLVVEVEYVGWTPERVLRAASFKGVREDRDPRSVGMPEQPAPAVGRAPRTPGKNPRVMGIAISNPDKVLYPEDGISKYELCLYYEAVAEAMLPFVVARPLTLLRGPDGYDKELFFQKHGHAQFPEPVKPLLIERGKGDDDEAMQNAVVIDGPEGLVALAQMGVLEVHVRGARADEPLVPDVLVFDLDPGEHVPWFQVVQGAYDVRDELLGAGLVSFVRTSGGKGLHVVAPIVPEHDWAAAAQFAEAIAGAVVRLHPGLYTGNISKAKRTGKIFIDHLRNRRSATAIASFSTRAKRGAPVSTNLRWEELRDVPGPQAFTLLNLEDRLQALRRDPWVGFFEVRQHMPVDVD